MTQENFKYWLQGFFEMKEEVGVNEKQANMILGHIGLVKEQDDFTQALVNLILVKKSCLSLEDEAEIKKMLSAFFTEETQGKKKGGTTLLRSC